MSHEASKAMHRRYFQGSYFKYFRGRCLDIGCGPDSINKHIIAFPLISKVDNWDLPQGDAQYLETIEDNTYDTIHASHLLEHLVDPRIGLENFIRVAKPGAHIIICVPELYMYEKSKENLFKFNTDHKHSFTIHNDNTFSDFNINIVDLAAKFSNKVETLKIEKIEDFYIPTDKLFDQTQLPNIEASVEWILRKR